ncbi:MAG: YceI family protein [Candidatus Eremiobacteraeota bacterium]|nr:YceI family protein [Candidatus Eremiobacteraeota bacterium]
MERTIDAGASKASFGLQHIFVERVTGTLPIIGGTLTLASGSAVPTSITALLDASKIETPEHDQTACIRSADYFDVKRFPDVKFSSTKIVLSGPDRFEVDGMLTMHGVAQPEHLDVTVEGEEVHPRYHAVGRIDRHAFGMKGMRLDPVIGSMVDVTLDIALK